MDLRGTNAGPSFLFVVYEPGRHADIAFLLAAQRCVTSHHWQFGDMPEVEGSHRQRSKSTVAYVRETQRVEGFDREGLPSGDRSTRRKSIALMETMMVERLMNNAPTAGDSTMPAHEATPAARGRATAL